MPEPTQIVYALKRAGLRLVLAESCTGGMVASALTDVPGVSEVFCGSAVTYRNQTKHQWLGVDSEVIRRETAVCATVAVEMACGALKLTPEADLAVSITGHLGPNAPSNFDGLAFIATGVRGRECTVAEHRLRELDRPTRRREAVDLVLLSIELLLEPLD